MKKSSRKRLLVSSVAMLLVAMLALGTATYAWFTNNTSTTADGIHVKTVQSSNLMVASKDYSFTNDLDYNYSNLTVKPASSATGMAWFSGEAARSDNFAIATGGTYSAISNVIEDNDYVYTNELNIRNYGTLAVENVKISFTIDEQPTTAGANYLRVAVVPKNAHNAASLGTLTGFTTHVFDKDGVAYQAVSATNKADTSITPSTTYTVDVPNLAAAGSAWSTSGDTRNEANYQIFVWFEGQDEQCKDTNAGNELPTITFSITGDPVSAA